MTSSKCVIALRNLNQYVKPDGFGLIFYGYMVISFHLFEEVITIGCGEDYQQIWTIENQWGYSHSDCDSQLDKYIYEHGKQLKVE